MKNPERRSSSGRALRLAFVPLLLALAAAGCSSAGDGSAEDEAASSSDAMTESEKAEGAAWSGEEEDFFTPDEEAALSQEGDVSDLGDDVTGSGDDVQTATLNPLTTCARQTGYSDGKQMSICTTTIDGKAVEQGTAAGYQKMRAAAAKAGVRLQVVSGFRTMAKQRELYALYKSGRGNLAAPPGYSNHQSGHALDLNAKARGVNAWLSAHAGAYGFRRTVPSENWHYEKW
ncbi:MAG: D-alanyl-D-alanine carboxypeptidase [Labilithrix sp.]|nr:D-alanyl-D-alanine carboxypeptidase [Labilithrix sp.]